MTTPGLGVTPDGSPVEVYLRLPGDREAAVVASVVPRGSSVLELGCGAGRMTTPLVADGYRVTAVDQSPEMLAHVRGGEAVLADVVGLDLGRRFDAVLLASRLVNAADDRLRAGFLAACAAHVAPDGIVLVERHEPGWVRTAEPTSREVAGVGIELRDLDHRGDRLAATVTFTVAGRRYDQRFETVDVDDRRLAAEAAAVGLAVDRWVDEAGEWVVLVPAGRAA